MVLNRTTIQIRIRSLKGRDELNRPIYKEEWEEISGCVVGSPSAEDIENEMNLSGKRIAYEIFIPRGDTHEFAGASVKIQGREYRVIGDVRESFVRLPHVPCDRLISVEAYG